MTTNGPELAFTGRAVPDPEPAGPQPTHVLVTPRDPKVGDPVIVGVLGRTELLTAPTGPHTIPHIPDDLRAMPLGQLIDHYAATSWAAGNDDDPHPSIDEITEIGRRLDTIERLLGEYRGSKALREGVRAAVYGARPARDGSSGTVPPAIPPLAPMTLRCCWPAGCDATTTVIPDARGGYSPHGFEEWQFASRTGWRCSEPHWSDAVPEDQRDEAQR